MPCLLGRARQVLVRRSRRRRRWAQYGGLHCEEESGKTARAQNELNSKAKKLKKHWQPWRRRQCPHPPLPGVDEDTLLQGRRTGGVLLLASRNFCEDV